MYAEKLSIGSTIGIICPSHIAGEDDYRQIAATLEGLGFRVKLGRNIYKDTDGYLASAQERADDLNDMVADDEVKMILFGGGNGAGELLPLIDYENIHRHPKRLMSYSDGTSILVAVYAKTGLVTYYGQGAGTFREPKAYECKQFIGHHLAGNSMDSLRGDGRWRTIRPDICEGILIGGYTLNFAMLLGGDYFRWDPEQKYLLFLEDYKDFSDLAAVSMFLSHVEQHPFIRNVSGLLFGHYADDVPEDLLRRLARFGQKYGVTVAYSDDFGHYTRQSILPIGALAIFDAGRQELQFYR